MWQLERSLFATRNDYAEIFARVESMSAIKYVLLGLFEDAVPRVFFSCLNLPHLGASIYGASTPEDRYLVMSTEANITVQPVLQRKGGYRFTLDQRSNPESIILQPGGLFDGRYLVGGEFGTISKDPASIALFRQFAKAIQRHFTYLRPFWLGPEALRLYQAGILLTNDVRNNPGGYVLESRDSKP